MGKISAFYVMPHPPIVVPKVGQGEEKKIQKTYDACKLVASEIKGIEPDTIIIITPHGPLFRDAVAISNGLSISGDLGQFRALEVSLNLAVNNDLVDNIITAASQEGIFVASITKDSAQDYGITYNLDHGSLVPLYFVNQEYTDYKVIHITYGMLPKIQLYKLGMVIAKVIEESRTNAVMIASGDLSHKLADTGPYDYSPSGPKFDQEIIAKLKAGDVQGIFNMDPVMVEEAGECGLRSFYMMLGAMNGHDVKGNLLSYEGTFGVGYAVMEFDLTKNGSDNYQVLINNKQAMKDEKCKHQTAYTKLARESLTHYVTTGTYMQMPDHLPSKLTDLQRGVFVTLYKEGQLRGCIGTIFPVMDNIAQEIIRNAVSAGMHDTRFDPVAEYELEELVFSVDVLTEPQAATQAELDPKKYGIIVRSGSKTGLLLPDLEGVDTIDYQLSVALDKGSISPSEPYTIEKFQVIRHR